MKNKKLLLLIPALAMVLGGCKEDPKTDEPKTGTDTQQPDQPNQPDKPEDQVVHPESVSLEETELAMDLGAETTLGYEVLPINASNTKVTWTSDHPEIVEVSARGKLTAKAEGTATITVTTEDGGKTASCVVTVTKPVWGTPEEPLTVAKVIQTADEELTTAKAVSKDVAYVTGYVISVTEKTGTNGKYLSNLYLADSKDETDAKKKFLVYSCDLNPNKSINAVYPGDKLVVKGPVQQYAKNDTDAKENWTLEMTNPKTTDMNVSPVVESLVVGTSTITLGSHDNATVNNLPASARNGSEFEFVVIPDQGYTVATVTYNGEAAVAVEGKENTYKGKVTGPTSVLVSTVREGVTVITKELESPKTNAALLGDGANNNATLGLDGHFIVTAEQGEASSNVACYDQFRIYAYNKKAPEVPEDSKKGNNNKLNFTGVGITFTSIVITCSQNEQYLKVMANGAEVTGESGTFKIEGKSFTITNSYTEATASTHVYIEKIVLNYTEDERVAATGIEVSKESVELTVGKDETVTATVSPADSTDVAVWTSSDETIATVTEGKIKAIKEGTCTVTATAGDFHKDIAVTVNAVPTFENLTGKTLATKAEYYDEATGKGVAKNPCVLAGYITEITSTSYGNGWFKTVDDVTVQIYGMYDITGNVRYDKLDAKPVAGDFVVLEGEHINYHNNTANTDNPELKNAKLLQLNNTKYDLPVPTAIAAPSEAVEVVAGSTVDLMKKISITPKGANTEGMTFSSDSANATVDPTTGVVTGVTAGKANITVSYTGLNPVTFEITVKSADEAPTKYEMVFGTAGVKGSTSSYTGNSDLTLNGIKWNVPGNQTLDSGVKLGGKLSSETTRSIYSVDKLEANVSNIVITFGDGDDQITVTGLTVKTYASAADAKADTNVVSSATATYVESSAVTFTKPEGATWNTGFYRFDFKMTSSAPSSNKGIIVAKITFNFVAQA